MRHRLTPLLGAIAGIGATTGCSDEAGQLANTRAELASLRAALAWAEPRATAYLGLEFLGAEPAGPGHAVRFRILQRAATPSPQDSAYPDCVVVMRVAWLDPADAPTAGEALVAMAVFHDHEPTLAATLAEGTAVAAQVVPWQAMPDSVHSIQRVNETDAFDLPLFAAIAPTAL